MPLPTAPTTSKGDPSCPYRKNQVLTLQVERLSSDGSGVAHSPEGETVFIPGAAPGDEARVRIVKDCKRYAFGILDEVLTPSPDRIPVDCAVAGPCGGCSLRHLDYAAELRAKQEKCCRRLCTHRRAGCSGPSHRRLPGDRPIPQQSPVSGRNRQSRPPLHWFLCRAYPPYRSLSGLPSAARRAE